MSPDRKIYQLNLQSRMENFRIIKLMVKFKIVNAIHKMTTVTLIQRLTVVSYQNRHAKR